MDRRWQLRPQDPALASSLAQELGLHPALCQALINRRLDTPQAARRFLRPSLKHLANPFLLPDLEAAAECLAEAVLSGRRVGVYGDYDADGVTSTAIFLHFFKKLGLEASFYLPDRLSQGYGLHPEGLDQLAGQGVEVVVTADCGSTDFEAAAHARRLGLRLILTDHHQPGPDQPQALAFVNTQRPDTPEQFGCLAGVGVIFFLLAGLRIKLREKGFFQGRTEPRLSRLLDLVALGTLADVAPVTGQNRILLTAGLAVMAQARRPGLAALASLNGSAGPVGPREAVFELAPRLNAPGRLGQAGLALRLLTEIDGQAAQELARRLDRLNAQRKSIEQKIMAAAVSQLEARGDPRDRLALVAAGPGWHPGVLGIVAARLCQRYHRPAVVLSIDGDTAAGSGRSIEPFHLHQGLANLASLLLRYGGHRQAAGLALRTADLPAFGLALEREVGQSLSQSDLTPTVTLDSLLSLDDLDDGLLDGLALMGPFGPGHQEPVFGAEGVGIVSARAVGQHRAHLSLKVRQGRLTWPAIAFGQGHLIDRLPGSARIAFLPSQEYFRGRRETRLHVQAIQPN